jgi:hypothetical protein
MMRRKKSAREMPQTAPPGESTMYYAHLKGKKLLWDAMQMRVIIAISRQPLRSKTRLQHKKMGGQNFGLGLS